MGTFTRKIHDQCRCARISPPATGPRIGASIAGIETTPITRPMRLGPATWAMISCATGMIMPAARALQDAAEHKRGGRVRHRAQRRADREEHERSEIDLPRPEAPRGPAGDGDHRGEREQVAGDHPLDLRDRTVQVVPERVQRDVHDRRVEDRHDHAEDHHTRDDPHVALDAVLGGGGGGVRGHCSHRSEGSARFPDEQRHLKRLGGRAQLVGLRWVAQRELPRRARTILG